MKRITGGKISHLNGGGRKGGTAPAFPGYGPRPVCGHGGYAFPFHSKSLRKDRGEAGSRWAAWMVIFQCVAAWIVSFIIHTAGLALGM